MTDRRTWDSLGKVDWSGGRWQIRSAGDRELAKDKVDGCAGFLIQVTSAAVGEPLGVTFAIEAAVFCGPPGYSRCRARYRPPGRLSMLATDPFRLRSEGRCQSSVRGHGYSGQSSPAHFAGVVSLR